MALFQVFISLVLLHLSVDHVSTAPPVKSFFGSGDPISETSLGVEIVNFVSDEALLDELSLEVGVIEFVSGETPPNEASLGTRVIHNEVASGGAPPNEASLGVAVAKVASGEAPPNKASLGQQDTAATTGKLNTAKHDGYKVSCKSEWRKLIRYCFGNHNQPTCKKSSHCAIKARCIAKFVSTPVHHIQDLLEFDNLVKELCEKLNPNQKTMF